MIKVENIYPTYEDDKKRKEKIQEAYTDIQKMFYNKRTNSKKTKEPSKNV